MSVDRSGTYWLEVSYMDCRASDSIVIDFVPTPNLFIGSDTTICEQFPHRIGTEIIGASYLWNTGATTSHITVSNTGRYIEEVTLRGCVVYDTVDITALPRPVIDLGGDRDICPDQTIVLNGSHSEGRSYVWNTRATTASIEVKSEGTYWVQVTTQHSCVGGDTVRLQLYPLPQVAMPEDTSVCEENPLVIRPRQLHADSLIWSDGSVGDQIAVRYGGEYRVTAVNKCGTHEDEILVKDVYCDIWLPNSFSPNGDGRNDVFRVLGNVGRIDHYSMSVFNRWGQRIFYTRDKLSGWDGNYNGAPAELGTYTYVVEYRIGERPFLLKGDFHLIR